MMHKSKIEEHQARTEADSTTTEARLPSAKLLPSPMLAAVIGQRVKHTELNYIGTIKADFQSGYCVVQLEDENLQELYPFGIRAKIDKLVAL